MKQKLLKPIYIIDCVVTLIFCFYICLLYLSRALGYLAMSIESYTLYDFQSAFQEKLDFGLHYEAAAMIPFYFLCVIIAITVFSAIFYIGTTISPVTHILLILRPLTAFIQFIPSPIFLILDIGVGNGIFYCLWYFVCLIAVIIYAVFITKFMCRDSKTLSLNNK